MPAELASTQLHTVVGVRLAPATARARGADTRAGVVP